MCGEGEDTVTSPSNAGTLTPAATLGAAPEDGQPDLSVLRKLLAERAGHIVDAWVRAQLERSAAGRGRRLSATEARDLSASVLEELAKGLSAARVDLSAPEYAELAKLLRKLSEDQANRGVSPTDTAQTVFSLKGALAAALSSSYPDQPEVLAAEIQTINDVVDELGLFTFEAYTAARDAIIAAQKDSLLELSTPVVKLWEGILAVPLIGTLDSVRTQMVMEGLLQAVVDTGSQVAIIDITGVPIVDTVVAQHLLKTIEATRLMGADTIISGIRPQIAQTMVHLGVEMGNITTKATLADAFQTALNLVGARLGRVSSTG